MLLTWQWLLLACREVNTFIITNEDFYNCLALFNYWFQNQFLHSHSFGMITDFFFLFFSSLIYIHEATIFAINVRIHNVKANIVKLPFGSFEIFVLILWVYSTINNRFFYSISVSTHSCLVSFTSLKLFPFSLQVIWKSIFLCMHWT